MVHNFFSSPVNTTRTLLARHVLSRSGVNRAIHFAYEAEGKKESESDDQGTRTFVRIMEEKENGKREKARREASPIESGPESAKRAGGRGRTKGVTRTPRRKDEGASARSCSLRPRRRRNRPIDSRIYRGGGMIQPGGLPRSLPPTTRDARDL